MADLATLAIKVENGDVVKATSSLNTMAVAGAKTEAATTRLTRRMALLEIEARNMDAAMVTTTTTTARLAASLGLTESATAKLGHAFAAFSAIAVAGFIGHKVIEETEAAQAAMAQLEAAVTSTGGAAGRSVAQLDALSLSLQKQTTFSDEAVKGAEAMLLTFDKIKGANFDRATAAVTDLATRMGTDLHGAAVQVGKALQDPATGLTALRRSGVSFSESQIAIIKSLYDTGRAAEGQVVILKELEHQFGGSAAAARDTLGGALAGLKNAWGDLFEVTRGASTGTVTAINAITHALETSGLSMNTVLKDATVDWETMRASIEKVRAILSLQVDSKFLENARNIIERIDFDLSTKIAELNAPAKTGPVGGGGGTGTDTMDAKVRAELARRDQEIAKQRALNAAFGASATTIALLNNAYDAQAERAKNAIDHTTAETAALNARTNAMQAAKDAAVLLAAAESNRKQVADVQRSDADAIRDAKQALELAGLSDAAAAQRRVDMQAENDLAAARLRFAMMTRDLDKERADVAAGILQREQDIYASTARRVEAVRQVGHETATVTAEMDKQKKAEEEIAREQERRARDIRRATVSNVEGILTDIANKRNPLIALADGFKRAMIHAISEALAERFLASKFAAMLGIGVEGSAKKQDMAGLKMLAAAKAQNDAADKMLRAAGVTQSGKPGETTQKPDTKVPAWVDPLVKGFGVALAAGYGGFQAGQAVTSTSHGTFGNLARGGLSGAATGAIAGFAIAGPIGAAAGAAVGFVAGMFGASKAMKEAAKAAEEMRKALSINMAALRADVGKDSLAAAEAQVEAQREQLRKQIEDAYSGGGANSDTVRERNKQLAELNALEDERLRQLREEAVVIAQRTKEDYQQRLDEATPGNERAEAIAAFNRKEDRELEDLKRSFGPEIDAREAATYAIAEQAIAAEKEKFARDQATASLNAFTTSVKNAPTGFKLEPYIQEFAQGRPYPGTGPINALPMPVNPFVPPTSPLSPTLPPLSRTTTTGASITLNNPTFNFPNIVDGKVAAKAFLAELDKTKNATGGLNATRGTALEVMPS